MTFLFALLRYRLVNPSKIFCRRAYSRCAPGSCLLGVPFFLSPRIVPDFLCISCLGSFARRVLGALRSTSFSFQPSHFFRSRFAHSRGRLTPCTLSPFDGLPDPTGPAIRRLPLPPLDHSPVTTPSLFLVQPDNCNRGLLNDARSTAARTGISPLIFPPSPRGSHQPLSPMPPTWFWHLLFLPPRFKANVLPPFFLHPPFQSGKLAERGIALLGSTITSGPSHLTPPPTPCFAWGQVLVRGHFR